MQPLEQSFLRNPNKPVTGDILAISKAMGFTAPRPAVNMVVLEERQVTKELGKLTKAANMEATKLSEATSMVITSNAAAGAETTDINWSVTQLHVLGRLSSILTTFHQHCVTTIFDFPPHACLRMERDEN